LATTSALSVLAFRQTDSVFGSIAMMPFEQWCEDAQALLAWHGIDPSRIAREDLWRMYRRGDPAIEAARLTANMARQEQEAWAAQGR
jgi:hypothetical protein